MCTVMVVDDDPEVREVIRKIASDEGHKVIVAANQEEALDAARSVDPDVIAMDLKLEKADGFDVLQRLRQAGLQGFAVIVSGNIGDRTKGLSRWKELRIFDVISKPFDFKVLISKLEAAADATHQEPRLCKFLDGIISNNELSLSVSLSGGGDGK